MNNHFNKIRISIYLSFFLLVIPAFAGMPNFKDNNPSWGGVIPGITKDKDVVARFGEGVVSSGLGHGPGRCYTNKEKAVTLIVDIGVDDAVESVTISKGLHFPPKTQPYISEKFNAAYNNDKSYLNATKADIEKLWGKSSKKSKNVDIYLLNSENGFKAIRVIFKNNKVYSIQYYNGEPIDFYGDVYETE